MHPLSPPSNAVRIYCQFLKHLGAEIEIEEKVIDLVSNEQKEGWYTAINPAGQVSTIKIGDDSIAHGHSALKLLASEFDRTYSSNL